MVVKIKNILLTFDIEEFDLPFEFNGNISHENKYRISKDGTEIILNLLEDNKIRGTFFISADFANKYPTLIKEISEKHEIGLHCYKHSDNYSKMEAKGALFKLKKAKSIVEGIIGKEILGFRAPRFQAPNYEIIKSAGFKYDSSYHPTYVPGRYNNFFKTRNIFSKENLTVIPVSVSPIIRLPLFWLAFRNMPLVYSKIVTNSCLINQNFVNLIFHPWEFLDIKKFKVPYIIKRNTGKKLKNKLNNYMIWSLEKGFTFTTISDYLLKNS